MDQESDFSYILVCYTRVHILGTDTKYFCTFTLKFNIGGGSKAFLLNDDIA